MSFGKGIPINAKPVESDPDAIITAGMEKMNAGVFYRMICNWKDSDVSPNRFKIFPPKESLPFQSVLHLLDNFKKIEEKQPISDICSFDNLFIKNENLRKILAHQLTPMTDGWIKTPKDYIYRTMQLTRNIEKFRSTNNGRFIIKRELKELATKDNALMIVNHNPIFRLFCRGTMLNWRNTQHYLASIFNTVQIIPERTHYFLIPLADKIFVRGKFNQISTRVAPGAIMDKSSIQYCLFAQLYNFLNVNCTLPNVFRDIPGEARKKIVLVFEHAGHYLFWPLQTLKDLNVRNKIYMRIFNHFNGFILRGITEKNAKLNTLANVEDDQTAESAKDVEREIIKHYTSVTKTPLTEVIAEEESTADDTDYISDKDAEELEEITRVVETFPLHLGEQTTTLDLTDVNDIIEGEDGDEAIYGATGISKDGGASDKNDNDESGGISGEPDNRISPDESITGKEFYTTGELNEIRLPDTDTVPFKEGKQVAQAGKEFMDDIDQTAIQKIQSDESLTNAQKERAKRMATSYKDVTIGKKTIEQILTEPVNPSLNEDIVENVSADIVPDRSMTKSSIVSMDHVYMEKMFERHLAGVIASWTAQGLYLTEVEKSITNTELSQTQTYTCRYKSVSGKVHSSTFSMPIIRPDGTFLVNGVRSTMSKQIATKPIAKLSDTRVSLSSYYNKTIVEKLASKAHDYLNYFTSTINHIQETNKGAISKLQYGIRSIPMEMVCGYEYAQIAKKYRSFIINHQKQNAKSLMYFGEIEERFDDPLFKTEAKYTDKDWKEIVELENKNNWIFVGCKVGNAPYTPARYFMDAGSNLHMVGNYEGKPFSVSTDILSLICGATDIEPKKRLTEWTDIKILDARFPVGFLLCYRFGLLNVLRRLNCKYELIGPRSSIPEGFSMTDSVVIPFSDKKLVMKRYPLKVSLILQGLTMFDTKIGALEDYDHKDIYYQLLLDKHMGAGRTNYLIGIDDTFDMFVDVITFERLKQMNEPTDFGGLLVRATEMLSLPYHKANNALANHCLKSYERLNGILYNEMAAQMRMYRKQRGPAATFSINPHAVMTRIVQDQTVMPIEDINPLHDIKTTTKLSYLGMGGRTAESIVADDRQFPPDGLGIISESTPSAGNVGIVTQSTMDPRVDNVSGIFNTDDPDLKPAQLISGTALYMPCVTQDDQL